MQAQLSSGAICLGFDLKVIYFHALIVKKIIINVNVKKHGFIVNVSTKIVKVLVSSNPNIVVGTKKNRLIETVLLGTQNTCLN